VDLDPGCVLYGAIELTPLDTTALFGWEIPRAAVTNGAMLLINLAFVVLFFKELKITSFDPALATTMGINANLMHYALMALVAATTIAAFESVGSILVIAMLIVPGAAAHLLTDRMPRMIVISLVFAGLSALIGHLSAITVPTWFGFRDTSTAGMMAVAAGALFLLAFLFAPRYGVLSRAAQRILLSVRIVGDDILGFLYRFREVAPAHAEPVTVSDVHEAVNGGALSRVALWNLVRTRRLRIEEPGVRLTEAGLQAAANLVRSHRLWESYLCSKRGFCETDVHYTAHRLEHFTDDSLQKSLAEEAGDPLQDPHRRPIPDPEQV
jgi:manganese/zinc/iron transport system permease protein